MSEIKLLPCPFCGSKNIDPEGWASTERSGPACDDCAGTADTIELWNSRPLSPPSPTEGRFELAGGWHLLRVEVNGAHEWIICDPTGDRLGNTPKHKAELDAVLRAMPLQDHGWQDISTAPTGDDDFYLVCCNDPADDRSPFVVRGSIFASARKHAPMHHLSLAYLTHWRLLPAKPAAMVAEERVEASNADRS